MKSKLFDINKYINKLKVAKAPVYIIGKENGLGLKNLHHPALNQTVPQLKEFQISEFYGNMKEDHDYMSENYKSHLIGLRDIDREYKEATQLDNRVKLSKNAISKWKDFVDESAKNLPEEEFKVREDTLIKLEDIWMRFKVNFLKINLFFILFKFLEKK